MKPIKIGNRIIGSEREPFVILEAGINHNGDLSIAKEMIRVAKQSGADAIKFQTFKAVEFISDPKQIYTYQSQGKEVTESMLKMFRRYEFSLEEWFEVKRACDEEGIIFLSTPQNISDMELLLEIGVPALKVGSDDFINIPLLQHYSKTGLPLILSCGMANLGEVHEALDSTGAFSENNVILLLCTSQYPTPPDDVNLLKLRTLSAAFPNINIGFSDHTQGPFASVIACGLGACVFEKHFTLDHNLPGPDHWFSVNPKEATEWIHAIRTAKIMLGSCLVNPTNKEYEMRIVARRSITVIIDISLGESFSEKNLGLRRPGDGLPPKMLELVYNSKARRALPKGHTLMFGDIDNA